MASENMALLIGNLGGAPDVRTTKSGNPVVSFTMATNKKWKDKKTGEQREHTEWHRIVIFGPLCEIAKKYLKKGSRVRIIGEIQTRKWEDTEKNVTRWTTEIVLAGPMSVLILLDKAPNGHKPPDAPPPPPAGGDLDDEIPF